MSQQFLAWRGPAAMLGALAISILLLEAFLRAGRAAVRRRDGDVGGALIGRAWWPLRFVVAGAVMEVTQTWLALPRQVAEQLHHLLDLFLIASVGALVLALVFALGDLALQRYPIDVSDNLRHRRVLTQVFVMQRVATVVVTVLVVAAMLLTFGPVRTLGASILASAGIAGVVLGLAARPIISNLLAGMQIAISGSIRIDDVVVTEGEWGRIEEITFTYVVVRAWDERRLIVPISYFTDRPFQNWTRQSAAVLGTAFIHVDYSVPIEQVRAELYRILVHSPLWDGRVWNLQVTDATAQSVQLRALASARDAQTSWDLRCEVREKLVEYLRREHPESLPRIRAELESGPGLAPELMPQPSRTRPSRPSM
jgi:small-conductance mechanosensitive channel